MKTGIAALALTPLFALGISTALGPSASGASDVAGEKPPGRYRQLA